MLSGYNKDWKLVSENGEVEFYVNYLSHVIVRTLLGVTFCVIFRILLSKCLYVGEGFGYFSIITDIISYGVSQMFPASLILAMIVLLSYFVIGFRFIYDVIITGHGLNWLFYQTKILIKKYEIEGGKRQTVIHKGSLSDTHIPDLYRNECQIDTFRIT
ncbi:hypothetical protein TNCT_29691 [Trichonephila clavata]|uniref:Uncharacterized protein n=1 Tax=Trichonephila clavata TaxID=2740835 RepID=A0A8X6L7G1_TRICU|nr:hypothetical protein TNCT_29691 [Trichonephila clavata]